MATGSPSLAFTAGFRCIAQFAINISNTQTMTDRSSISARPRFEIPEPWLRVYEWVVKGACAACDALVSRTSHSHLNMCITCRHWLRMNKTQNANNHILM